MVYKSVLLVFFILSNAVTCLSEDLRIIISGGLHGVADEDGEVLIPPVYELLGWSDGQNEIVNGSIGFLEGGSWGLLNIRSKKATSAKYVVLKPFGIDLFEAGIKGRLTNHIFHGLIDNRSRTHLDFRFFSLSETGDHRVIVSEYHEGRLKYGVFTDENERVIPVEYANLYREGQLLVAANTAKRIKLFDLNGRELYPHWLDEFVAQADGYLLASAGKYGMMNASGLLTHEPIYKEFRRDQPVKFPAWEIRSLTTKVEHQISCDSISWQPEQDLLIAHINHVEHFLRASDVLFSEQQHQLKHIGNGFIVTKNPVMDTWGLFKTDGQTVAAGYDSIAVDASYFFARKGNNWEIYNLFGRRINKFSYQAVAHSQEGMIPVRRNEYWGIVDFQADQLIDFKFDRLESANKNGHFLANYLNKWGVTTINGQWIILPEYDSIFTHGDLYVAKKARATHILSVSGQLKCKVSYKIRPVNFLQLESEDGIGVVTSSGHLVHPEYQKVKQIDDRFYLLRSGSYVTLIDENGREIIKETDQIQEVLSYSEEFFHIVKDGKHGFVDLNGKLRVANRYDDAHQYDEGMAPIMLKGHWGFIDKYETLVIQPYYANSSSFKNDLAIVSTRDGYGLINKSGEEVIQPSWSLIERLPTGNYRITDASGKAGLADADGNFLIRPAYDALQDTPEGFIIATQAGKTGILDYQGYVKLPFIYQEVRIAGDYMLLRKN